ncbi:MAG: hypothetical protein J6A30_01525 [Ruminococcus sp.]|nr:hypothetical protein [Ruminococcus sp.]
MNLNINDVMKKYTKSQILKIKDFLLSEIDDSELDEIIEFVKSDTQTKLEKFKELLYEGNEYDGVFLDGNQYIISSDSINVIIIDTMRSKYDKNTVTNMIFEISDFILLLYNKKQVLNY